MSRSLAASTELALRLAKSEVRGGELALVLTHDWLDRNKRHGELTASELRLKQAVWEWYSALDPGALERVCARRRQWRGRANSADLRRRALAAGAARIAPCRDSPCTCARAEAAAGCCVLKHCAVGMRPALARARARTCRGRARGCFRRAASRPGD